MKKDEFIGVRVSKKVKDKLRKEAKKEGMSISQYFESRIKGNFEEPKLIVQALISNGKENRPKYWEEADKWEMTRALEGLIPVLVSGFVDPPSKKPYGLPMNMSFWAEEFYRAIINNIDSISDLSKGSVSMNALQVGNILAENLNKLKGSDIAEQKQIIEGIRNTIENLIFHFSALAFEKEAYLNIKKELDRVADSMLFNIKLRELKSKQKESDESD